MRRIIYSPIELLKTKYTRRWKGKDGKWNYEYAKPTKPQKEEKQETFSSAMIEKLRQQWSSLKRIDPESPTYEALTSMLDALDSTKLRQLESANINFVSVLARNRLVRRGDYEPPGKVYKPLRLVKGRKRVPVGTVSHGRKKVAEGKWVPVKRRGKRKKAISEEAGTLPLDVSTLTESSTASLIKRCAKMPMKTLRKYQAIVKQQSEKAFKDENLRAIDRLEVMEDIYIAAIDIKEFKDSTPEEWGKEIVGRMGRQSARG